MSTSIYMERLFLFSNSSLLLPKGTALKAEVVRLSDDKYLVDAGLGDTVTCMKDEQSIPSAGLYRSRGAW